MLNKEWLKSVLEQCQEYGYRTVPFFPKDYEVNGVKIPSRKFKDGQDYKSVVQFADAESVAIVLDDLVLLDYDGNKGTPMPLDELEEALDFDLVGMPEPFQINDDGDSIHWLFKLPGGDGLKHSADGKWKNIDIKCGNQLVHLKPHKTLNLKPMDEWEHCPAAIVELLRAGATHNNAVDEEDDLMAAVLASEAMEEDELREYVSKQPRSALNSYGSWLSIIMAIHHASAGAEYGRQIANEWSKGADTYNEDELNSKWDSFDISRNGTMATTGTLVYNAKGHDFEESLNVASGFVEQINAADRRTIELDVCKKIRQADISDVDRAVLESAVQARLSALEGVRVPVKVARDLITPARGELTEDFPRPDWCEPWVYLASHEVFLNIDTSLEYSRTAFDMAFGRLMVLGDNGQKVRPSKFIADHGFVEVLPRKEYLPMIKGRIIDQGGYSILNSFDPRSVPIESAQYTEDGLKAVEVVKRHFRLLCNGVEQDALVLEQWFAHQVQNMGIKLPWAPLICSIQGVGKSVLETMLRNVIGRNNVGTVAPKSVLSDFNGWATDVSVNVLNELRIGGKNRHEAANALKPLITDDTIQINDKNSKVYQTRNTADYICFTNFVDAIPMDETDRRWWAIRVTLDSLDAIKDRTGVDRATYFDELHWAIRTQGGQLRKWLLEYEISEEFKALRTAPETQFKLDMVATERSTVEYLDEVRDIIGRGEKWIHPKCVCMQDLMREIGMDPEIDAIPKTGEVKQILKRLGFTSRSNQVVMDGETKRVWTKGDMSNDDIRALFSH